MNLFDVLTLEDKFSGSVPPVKMETLTINDLRLNAIGGALSGSAELRFDNSDLVTYDGLPKPIGDAFLSVSGANRVLDLLQTAGALTESEVSGARLAMGMIARATGDDSFETSIEFSEDGKLSLNGQRIR